jgi:hypothetical protein
MNRKNIFLLASLGFLASSEDNFMNGPGNVVIHGTGNHVDGKFNVLDGFNNKLEGDINDIEGD